MTPKARSRQSSPGRLCIALTAAWLLYALVPNGSVAYASVWAQEDPEKVRVKIVTLDAHTGEPTPTRLEVVDDKGVGHMAINSMPLAGDPHDRAEPWLGSPQEAKEWVESEPHHAIWHTWSRGPQFYSSGEAFLTLPPGRYTISAFKGIEYFDVEDEFVVETNSEMTLTYDLERWVHLAEEGWYSADDHIHVSRFTKDLDPMILECMKAEDINVANLLRWGHSRHFYNTPQHTSGIPSVYREGDFLLLSGQEHPRTHFLGYTIILGASPAIHQDDRYLLFRLFFEHAHRHGAANGFAHKGGPEFQGYNGLSVNLPDGFVHFIEVLQFMEADYTSWYDALNTGFRITPTAGSDFPFGFSHPGRERVYTKVEGGLTAPKWLQAVKAGRTFVTNGPVLELSVNDKKPGDSVVLSKKGTVKVEGRIRFNETRDRLDDVELIWCGEPIEMIVAEGSDYRFEFERQIDEAGWFALRSTGVRLGFSANPNIHSVGPPKSLAHTGPIYVSIQGEPSLTQLPRAKRTAQKWINYLVALERTLREEEAAVEQLATDEPFTGVPATVIRKNREDLLHAVHDALVYFRNLQAH